MPTTIALIAHDSKKDAIVDFAKQHAPLLGRYRLIATAATGERIQWATGLKIESMLPGPEGGDIQIGAEVVNGNVLAVIFLVDPLYAQPHEPDIQAFLRICNFHNVMLATNLATAATIVQSLAQTRIAHLIFNPVAGQGNPGQELSLIQQLLEPHMQVVVRETKPDVDPAAMVLEAIEAQADLVIASGGDGTISAVAGALVGTEIPLGIIPRGTANAFAAALGIPRLLPIRNACQVILSGNIRTVDAATCNGLPMVLLAGVGYEAVTVELASREMKDQWGALAYLMAGWQTMESQTLFETEIEAEGTIYHFEASAITIANAAPPTSILAQGGGQVIFDDGLLDMTIATAETKLQGITTMLRMMGAALTGTGVEHQTVVHLRAKRLRVTTHPPQKVVVDGEIVGTTPIEVECIPDGLKVFAPSAPISNEAIAAG
ncbi:MAG: methylglyoxal synthase [Oscillatoriophycideae cyanobacterium NC_groundwater_1537_Pr4_S-0.65um_50_18]|nr:methylglyoxal synthase [Oscillatoriophycideae cyanobacterium NC_groundwater_1537_Pr4_S-0.65um_50_18]